MEQPNLENSLSMTIGDWLYYHQKNIHFKQKYRGLNMIKNPFDLVIYEEMLWEFKPDIIIEIGNAFGGFSLWLADRMKMIGAGGKFITIDLDLRGDTNLKDFKSDKFVSIVGNCNDKEVINKIRSHIGKNDSVLIIEDSAHSFENTLAVLENYKDIVTVGSYFIIEDGICDLLDLGIKPGPTKAVEEWIEKNQNYKIDRSKERYIMTYNPKGYLKKLAN